MIYVCPICGKYMYRLQNQTTAGYFSHYCKNWWVLVPTTGLTMTDVPRPHLTVINEELPTSGTNTLKDGAS